MDTDDDNANAYDTAVLSDYAHAVDEYGVKHGPNVYDASPELAAEASSSSIFDDMLSEMDFAAPSTGGGAAGAGPSSAGAAHVQTAAEEKEDGENIDDDTGCAAQDGVTQPGELMPYVEMLMGKDDDGAPMCKRCYGRFVKRGNLQRHVLHVHFKHRPFACPHCSMTFGYKAHLRRHIAAVHPPEDADGVRSRR